MYTAIEIFCKQGPNTVPSYTSYIFSAEVQVSRPVDMLTITTFLILCVISLQVNYIVQMIKPIISGQLVSVEVTETAADSYNAKLQGRFSDFVYLSCMSWFRIGGSGKVVPIFPGS